MRITLRTAAVTCGATLASVVTGMATAMSAWGASTTLVVGGLSTPTMHDAVMSQLLGGALPDPRVSVFWPAEARGYTGPDDLTLGQSIAVGVENLDAEMQAALDRLTRDADGNVVDGERVTVVGLSAGSLVVTEVLRDLADDADAPDRDDIEFIVVADSSRQEIIDDTENYNPDFDYTYRPAPETVYDTTVVTGEYDGLADFPDRWWNLTAVTNAMAGSIFVHIPAMFADLSEVPEENITRTVNAEGGVTTHYLVPTETLPLVRMFPSLAPREAELREQVDRGYSRNDPPTTLSSIFAQQETSEETQADEVASDPEAPRDTVKAVRSGDTDDDSGELAARADSSPRDESAAADVPARDTEADENVRGTDDDDDVVTTDEADDVATDEADDVATDEADDVATDEADDVTTDEADEGGSRTDSDTADSTGSAGDRDDSDRDSDADSKNSKDSKDSKDSDSSKAA